MAVVYILPNIGASGVIKLKAPFDHLCAENVPYEVSGVRLLSDITATGQDPFGLYYQPYEIEEDKYLQDVKDGVCLLSLRSPTGETVFVPNSYLISLPVSMGIPYSTMMVAVNLGALPHDLSLSYFMAQVQAFAHDLLGVGNADVRAIKASTTTYLSVEDSETIENARKVIMQDVITDAAKLRTAEESLQQLRQTNDDLEAFILTHLPPP